MIDANGLVVAPGFIDPHTHYDAQICWDQQVTPSSWHGVTTVIMGSCGVGVAPASPKTREAATWDLVNLESIPFDVLNDGLTWDWDDFPSFMQAAQRRGCAINLGFQAPLTPFRHFVMGEESTERAATEAETAQIERLLSDAIGAGAVGISTTVSKIDVGYKGRPLARRLASFDELRRYARVLRKHRRGLTMIHVISQPDQLTDNEYSLLDFLLTESGRPVTWLGLFIREGTNDPDATFKTLDKNAPLFARGSVPQISCRPLLFELQLRQPFLLAMLPAAQRILNQPLEVQKKLYGDHAYRRQLESEVLKGGTANAFVRYDRQEVSHVANPRLKQFEGKTIAQVASMRGVAPSFDLLIDLALEDDLNASFMLPILNTDEARLARLVADPRTLIALSDGGAHVDQLCDSGYATYLLGHWVREQQALSLEYAVKRITSEPADLFGLRDRGRLIVGAAADIAIFDPQTVGSGLKGVMRHDLPGGRRRLVMPATGIHHTIVNGELVYDHAHTPALFPGRSSARLEVKARVERGVFRARAACGYPRAMNLDRYFRDLHDAWYTSTVHFI